DDALRRRSRGGLAIDPPGPGLHRPVGGVDLRAEARRGGEGQRGDEGGEHGPTVCAGGETLMRVLKDRRPATSGEPTVEGGEGAKSTEFQGPVNPVGEI